MYRLWARLSRIRSWQGQIFISSLKCIYWLWGQFLFSGCQRFIHRCTVVRTWSWPLATYSVKVKIEWRCTSVKPYGHCLCWPIHQSGLFHNKTSFILPRLLVSYFLTSVSTYPRCFASPYILFFPRGLFSKIECFVLVMGGCHREARIQWRHLQFKTGFIYQPSENGTQRMLIGVWCCDIEHCMLFILT